MNKPMIRTTLFIILISSVVAAAVIGVGAVLTGGFNDVLYRALWTIFIAVIHSLLALAYVATQKPDSSKVKWTSSALFVSIIISFLVAVLGLWDVVDGSVVWNTYQVLGVLMFATFHAEVIASLRKVHALIDGLIYANVVFILFVATLLTILIYADDYMLGEFFGRILGATAIIDGTLTLLVIILERMKAPHRTVVAQSAQPGQVLPPTRTSNSTNLVVIFIAVTLGLFQLFGGFFWALFL